MTREARAPENLIEMHSEETEFEKVTNKPGAKADTLDK